MSSLLDESPGEREGGQRGGTKEKPSSSTTATVETHAQASTMKEEKAIKLEDGTEEKPILIEDEDKPHSISAFTSHDLPEPIPNPPLEPTLKTTEPKTTRPKTTRPKTTRPKTTKPKTTSKKSLPTIRSSRKPTKRVIEGICTWGDPQQANEALDSLSRTWREVRIMWIQFEPFASHIMEADHPMSKLVTDFSNIMEHVLQDTGPRVIDPRNAFALEKYWGKVARTQPDEENWISEEEQPRIQSFSSALEKLVAEATYYGAIFTYPDSQTTVRRRKKLEKRGAGEIIH
ncbi:hypothetical protein DM02DRAFT_632878 [Periconia macrospinosa]|uniref:Uncharacterized protein n=1 Tax=Periconia macrospinosa TaxID=97972 RepID=A0A2V1DBE7_9PLEO|nr:hypothetical protein DM02DRAFT_632878 [Periconia macrospinosa]